MCQFMEKICKSCLSVLRLYLPLMVGWVISDIVAVGCLPMEEQNSLRVNGFVTNITRLAIWIADLFEMGQTV